MKVDVFGLGNPIIDILVHVEGGFIEELGLTKGAMHLITEKDKNELLNRLGKQKFEIEAGGSAPNTMATLSLLGINTGIAGKIGKDELGDKYLSIIGSKNVKSYLKRGTSETGTSIILITPDKERTMNTYLGACKEFGPEDLPPDSIEEAKIFYFTGYMWDTENQKSATMEGIKRAKKAGTQVVFDVADPLAVERYREDFLNLIENHVDILFANAAEAKMLMEKELNMAVKELSKICKLGVIKNGEKNSFIFNEGEIIEVQSFKTDVVDTTGAGDNYAAGFLYGILKGYSLRKCGEIASFIASKTIEKVGAHAPGNIAKLVKILLGK